MTEKWNFMSRTRVVPIVEVLSIEHALRLADIFEEFSFSCIEIPLRTELALDAIASVSSVSPLVIGAGTIRDSQQMESAISAGAQFGVSPYLRHDLVERANELNFSYMPAIATPTEARRASDYGCTAVKIFPANTLGSSAFIRAVEAVLPELKFMPSGGVNDLTASEYLSLASVIAVSGSWLCPPSEVHQEDWESIRQRLSRFQEIAKNTYG